MLSLEFLQGQLLMHCEHFDKHLASERGGEKNGGNRSDFSEGGN